MILLQPTYFAPIIQYAAIAGTSCFLFEAEDNYQKQTYRNRCYIYGPNGKQLLNIPTKHLSKTGKTKTKDIRIDYDTSNWRQNHLRSMQAAYSGSPFFEYYEDDIHTIFNKKPSHLLDLNLAIHDFVMEALQEPGSYTLTESFESADKSVDLRTLANAKKTVPIRFPVYPQMFDHKYGFIENLSILDLLFMEGPASYKYLLELQALLSIKM